MKRLLLPVMTIAVMASAATAADYKTVLLENVPHVKQKPDFCGEACVEMWTASLKRTVTQDQVFNQSGVKAAEARGCVTREMAAVLGKLGFAPGQTWYPFETAKAAAALEEQFAALHADLARGVPSIVCMHYDEKPQTTEHFRLILGYDAKTDEVIYNEPAIDKGSYQRMARGKFLKLWPLTSSPTQQTAIRMKLEIPAGGKVKEIAATKGFTEADYSQHIMELTRKIPPKAGFSYMVQPPFVVISDLPVASMQGFSEKTIKWAVEKLQADFFEKQPADVLDVWLFKDENSYNKYTKEIYGDNPTTPYGYYSPSAKALLMNINTGGGTLVHEIVHPFMATNFPACPPWFNEGMGSLFEQCGEKGGRIIGYTNWRLAGLQAAIKADKVPPFEALFAMNHADFYTKDRGTNYAQSRYLLYYLQEKGLLQKYYKEFTANAKDDPTGFKTMKKVLGENDMEKFKTTWQKYVLELKFP